MRREGPTPPVGPDVTKSKKKGGEGKAPRQANAFRDMPPWGVSGGRTNEGKQPNPSLRKKKGASNETANLINLKRSTMTGEFRSQE